MFKTDYPFTELGDEPGKPSLLRDCKVITYDGDKYCEIEIDGKILSVKRGYIYRVEALSHEEAVENLPVTMPANKGLS